MVGAYFIIKTAHQRRPLLTSQRAYLSPMTPIGSPLIESVGNIDRLVHTSLGPDPKTLVDYIQSLAEALFQSRYTSISGCHPLISQTARMAISGYLERLYCPWRAL